MKQKDTNELKNIFSNLLKENKLTEINDFILDLTDEKIKEIVAGQNLLYPIKYNDLEMAKLLVKYGVDVNKDILFDSRATTVSYYHNDDRRSSETVEAYASPLYQAAYKNQSELAKFLLENGAEINKMHISASKYCYDSSTDLSGTMYYTNYQI